MPTLTRRKTAPAVDDPAATFAERFAELLKRHDKARAEYEVARAALEEATIADLVGTRLPPGKLATLEADVRAKERTLEDLEAATDRARGLSKRFQAQADAQTLTEVQRQRGVVREQWERALEREAAITEDLARVIAQARALEGEDEDLAQAERGLRQRSLGAGRVIPAATGGAFDVIVPSLTPKNLRDAIEAARAQAVP